MRHKCQMLLVNDGWVQQLGQSQTRDIDMIRLILANCSMPVICVDNVLMLIYTCRLQVCIDMLEYIIYKVSRFGSFLN